MNLDRTNSGFILLGLNSAISVQPDMSDPLDFKVELAVKGPLISRRINLTTIVKAEIEKALAEMNNATEKRQV